MNENMIWEQVIVWELVDETLEYTRGRGYYWILNTYSYFMISEKTVTRHCRHHTTNCFLQDKLAGIPVSINPLNPIDIGYVVYKN